MGTVVSLPLSEAVEHDLGGYPDETLADRLLTRFGVWSPLIKRDPFGPVLADEAAAQFLETGFAAEYFSDVTDRRSVYGMLRPAADVVPEMYDVVRIRGREMMIKKVTPLPSSWGRRAMFEIHLEG